MIDSKLSTLILSVLTAPILILSIACGGEDAGLSRAEVEEIVRAELAEPGLTSADVEKAIHAAMADMPQPEAGLSKSEVEEIVKAAVAAMPQPDPGLTSAEAEQIARGVVASIPPRSSPIEYTKFFVEKAISRYKSQGLDATLAYYNRPESIDGQWYVFIIDETDLVIGHPDASAPGAGREGLGGHRRQRLQLRAGHAVGHRGRQVGVIRVPEPGERGPGGRLHR